MGRGSDILVATDIAPLGDASRDGIDESEWRHMIKLLGYLAAGAVALFVLFCLAFMVMTSVGHLNFLFERWTLQSLPSTIREVTVAPGERVMVEHRDGRLKRTEIARDFVIRDADGRLFLEVDRGGGHLGIQGYIYSDDPDVDVSKHPAFGRESYEYKHVGAHWWSYDSTED